MSYHGLSWRDTHFMTPKKHGHHQKVGIGRHKKSPHGGREGGPPRAPHWIWYCAAKKGAERVGLRSSPLWLHTLSLPTALLARSGQKSVKEHGQILTTVELIISCNICNMIFVKCRYRDVDTIQNNGIKDNWKLSRFRSYPCMLLSIETLKKVWNVWGEKEKLDPLNS